MAPLSSISAILVSRDGSLSLNGSIAQMTAAEISYGMDLKTLMLMGTQRVIYSLPVVLHRLS